MANLLLTQPKQDRSKASVKAIEDTVYRTVLDGGLKSMTTNSIAEAAKVDISVLYRYFACKETLALHLLQKIVAELDEQNAKESRMVKGGKKSMWWKGEPLQKMVFVALMRSYTPETVAFIQTYRKTAEDRIIKQLKSFGAKGRPSDWRISIRFLANIQGGMLVEVSNTVGPKKSPTLQKRVVDAYEKTTALIMGQYFE